MKFLIGLMLFGSLSAFADQIKPGEYNEPEEIAKIMTGDVSNLESKDCPARLLARPLNLLNISMGAKLIGITVGPAYVANGHVSVTIYPKFAGLGVNQIDSQTCYLTNVAHGF